MTDPGVADSGTPPTPFMSLDAEIRDRIPEDFAGAIDFHGHLCPGLTIGYRSSSIALARLTESSSADEDLVGIVENDACGVDAFQYMTGCTLGKGNLVYRDLGKQAFTVVRRKDGRGVRVALRNDIYERDPRQAELRALVMSGQANEEERSTFWRNHISIAMRLLDVPEEHFATVTSVDVEVPDKARIFDTQECAVCGEAVMEPRLRIRDGKPCCIPCAGKYSRGWEINA